MKRTILSLTLVIFGCAGQFPPQGGPPDNTPPKIIYTEPENNSILFKGDRFVIEFDEYVDKRVAEESIFISPDIKVEYDWSGTEIEGKFLETLREKTTYVITVGTDVVDIHSTVNRMTNAFTLAFSTGEKIDKGIIRGRVFSDDVKETEGVMVFAYKISRIDPDTLNPIIQKPDYITQTGTNGHFVLTHLPTEKFRIIAVKDEYRNLVYDPEVDKFGMPIGDISLTETDTIQSDIYMHLAVEDTTRPRLIKTEAVNRRHLQLEFSEGIDTSSISKSDFTIVDTVSNIKLDIVTTYPEYSNHKNIHLYTEEQDTNATYLILVTNLRDANNLAISPLADAMIFSPSPIPDTINPRIMSIRDSLRNVDISPEIIFQISTPLKNGSIAINGTLLSQDSLKIPCHKRNITATIISFTPENDLMPKQWYTFHLNTFGGVALNGKLLKDSLYAIRFETEDIENYSSMEGTLSDESPSDKKGNFYLSAIPLQKEVKPVTIKLEKEGHFNFTRLQEGHYVLKCFRDRNGNNIFDAGKPYRFTKSERFSVFPDTLKLRARWPLDGIQFRMR